MIITELEAEAKVLLNYKAYSMLVNHFKLRDALVIKQTNYYFDTKSFDLAKMKATVRIRSVGSTYVLTLKTDSPEGRLETNENISSSCFTNIMNGDFVKAGNVPEKIRELGLIPQNLQYFDSLNTKRYQINYNDVVYPSYEGKLCIDQNTYGDTIDYEVEYEGKTIESAKKTLAKLMEDLNLPFSFSNVSKVLRVLRNTIR
jgi:uncharacterized protein YjbK